MPKLVTDITAQDWSPKLGAFGEVVIGLDDISQCITIILNTPKGSDPHRPLFGSDIWRYIDYPVNEAIPHVVREVVDALTLWEPRIKLVSVTPVVDGSHVTLRVEWKLNDNEPVQSTEVAYGRAA